MPPRISAVRLDVGAGVGVAANQPHRVGPRRRRSGWWTLPASARRRTVRIRDASARDRAQSRGRLACAVLRRGRQRLLPEAGRAEADHRARAALARALDRDPAAERDPGDVRIAVQAERVVEVEHRARQVRRARLDSIRQRRRVAEAGHVDRDRLALARQPLQHRRPLDQGAAERMQAAAAASPLPARTWLSPRSDSADSAVHSPRSYSTQGLRDRADAVVDRLGAMVVRCGQPLQRRARRARGSARRRPRSGRRRCRRPRVSGVTKRSSR